MEYVVSQQISKTKNEHLKKRLQYAYEGFTDVQLDKIIKFEIDILEDNVIRSIINARIKVGSPESQVLAARELMNYRIQKKLSEIEENLKIMVGNGSISKIEHQAKLRLMKENQQNMQDDIERGEIIDNDQINQLEKTLGIVSEKMQDPKILEDYAKYNGSMKHQR